jgi:hypothetical protein
MAKSTHPELTRLHYLTDSEADLILDFRLLSAPAKECISGIAKAQAGSHVEPTGGNVVSITRRAAD